MWIYYKYYDQEVNRSKYIEFRLIKKSFELKFNNDKLFKLPLPTNGGSKKRKSGTKKKRRKTKRI